LVALDKGDGQPLSVASVTDAMSQVRNLFCKKAKDWGTAVAVGTDPEGMPSGTMQFRGQPACLTIW
jgi:hypothetical protein